MKLSGSISGAIRTFSYFMASGSHYMLEGISYLDLYGNEPSAIEQAFAIYVNVLDVNTKGQVLNAKHAEKRATQYIRSYCDPNYEVIPPFKDWELVLHSPPPKEDLI